jgi:antitoxin component of MazEF toxin-antitoxin module
MTEDKADGKPVVGMRKVTKVGGSKMIALPPDWLEQHNIQEGDEVTLIANCDIRICAPGKSKEIYDKITQVVKEAETDKQKEDTEA